MKADEFDSIIFDCDGVLIDVTKSYDTTINRTISYVLKEIANIEGDIDSIDVFGHYVSIEYTYEPEMKNHVFVYDLLRDISGDIAQKNTIDTSVIVGNLYGGDNSVFLYTTLADRKTFMTGVYKTKVEDVLNKNAQWTKVLDRVIDVKKFNISKNKYIVLIQLGEGYPNYVVLRGIYFNGISDRVKLDNIESLEILGYVDYNSDGYKDVICHDFHRPSLLILSGKAFIK